MGWNHRIVKRVFKTDTNEEETYGIHEAYYDKKGKVFAISKEPDGICSDTLEGLHEMVGWLNKLMEKTKEGLPILDYNKIPEEGAEEPWQRD